MAGILQAVRRDPVAAASPRMGRFKGQGHAGEKWAAWLNMTSSTAAVCLRLSLYGAGGGGAAVGSRWSLLALAGVGCMSLSARAWRVSGPFETDATGT